MAAKTKCKVCKDPIRQSKGPGRPRTTHKRCKKTPKKKAKKAKKKKRARGSSGRKCGKCGRQGHNRKTCTKRAKKKKKAKKASKKATKKVKKKSKFIRDSKKRESVSQQKKRLSGVSAHEALEKALKTGKDRDWNDAWILRTYGRPKVGQVVGSPAFYGWREEWTIGWGEGASTFGMDKWDKMTAKQQAKYLNKAKKQRKKTFGYDPLGYDPDPEEEKSYWFWVRYPTSISEASWKKVDKALPKEGRKGWSVTGSGTDFKQADISWEAPSRAAAEKMVKKIKALRIRGVTGEVQVVRDY